MDGRRVVITGAATGIGAATARRLAALGARVAAIDRNGPALASLEAEIRKAGGCAMSALCNVTDEIQVAAAMAQVREAWGGLDTLILAAGILRGAFQQVDEIDEATFRSVLDVNLTGTFLCCRQAVADLEASRGVILCIASGAGVRGPSSSLAYAASKGGVNGLAMTLEQQLAPRGIRVNVVCPGAIDTPLKRANLEDAAAMHGINADDMIARASLGDPDGVARVLAFLAGPDGDYVRGAVFTR